MFRVIFKLCFQKISLLLYRSITILGIYFLLQVESIQLCVAWVEGLRVLCKLKRYLIYTFLGQMKTFKLQEYSNINLKYKTICYFKVYVLLLLFS